MNELPSVLMVDDDASARETLRGVLISQGYELFEATSGKQAIEIAREQIPDLILLDVMMPGMDGFEVCQQLRIDPVLHEIPVVMVTALDDRASRIRGIEAGADDFISKPFDRVELRARVSTITRLSRYRTLLLERARFVWVIENDQDGYLILDEHNDIHYANAAARQLFNLPEDLQSDAAIGFLSQAKNRFICQPEEKWEAWLESSVLATPLYLIQPQSETTQPIWLEIQSLDLPWLSKKQRLLRVKDVTQTMSLTLETWSFQSAARHKLLTPLTNILLSTEVIRLFQKDVLSPDVLECVDTIDISARRLQDELRDILEYIYAPLMSGPDNHFPLKEMESLIRQISADLNLAPVAYSVRGDVGLIQMDLKFSLHAMRILLLELLENAKKFHPSLDPRVEICLSLSNPNAACLEIIDDGIHLSPEQLTRVFIPYYQCEKVFSGEVEGMGLGLPTVAALVWQSGGQIQMQNRQDGVGIKITLNIPLAEK